MKVLIAVAFLLLTATANASPPTCLENTKCRFVNEYIREMAELNELLLRCQKELAQTKKEEMLSLGIYDTRRKINAMHADVEILKSMPTPNDTAKTLIQSYELLIAMNQRLADILTAFMVGPKPGVDFGSMAAEMPKIRADMDETTSSFLTLTNLVFAELFDLDKQDKNGHVELAITRAQRQELIRHVNNSFGEQVLNNLKGKEASWTLGAADVMRTQLMKNFTAADDPIA